MRERQLGQSVADAFRRRRASNTFDRLANELIAEQVR